MTNTSEHKGALLAQGAVLSGKYRIERELGTGASGRVYSARHLGLARDVAIKVLRDERATHDVRHPHVVDVLDAGVEGGVPYIVEELLVGEDLAHYVARKGGRLTPRAALERMLPVVDGVAHAHARGVVHRDLKPENVFLATTPDGIVPKVLDFGLAKDPAALRVVAPGAFEGTPWFTAPEQILRYEASDARADVWSLGVMLYELLAGHTPFRETETRALLVEICTREPLGLDVAVPELPPALVAVVHRCLQRDPAGRYLDAGALVEALRALPEAPAPQQGRLQTVAASIAPRPLVGEHPAEPPPVAIARTTARPARFEAPDDVDDEAHASLPPLVHGLPGSARPLRVLGALASLTLVAVAVAAALHRPPTAASTDAPPVTRVESLGAAVASANAAAALQREPAAAAPVAPAVAAPAAPVVLAAPAPAARVTPARAAAPLAVRTRGAAAPGESAAPEAAAASADEEAAAHVPAGESADQVVQRAVAEHDDEIHDCIAHAEIEEGGRVSVRLVIARGGGVRSATPVAPPALRAVAQCIASEMRAWPLEVPDAAGDSRVTWPFEIDPDAE